MVRDDWALVAESCGSCGVGISVPIGDLTGQRLFS